MNNDRRKRIAAIYEKIEELQSDIQEIADEEECYRDDLPENFQTGERYEKSEQASEYLEYAIDELAGALENLENAQW